MQSLKHVENAIRHCEALADEASDLKENELAAELHKRAQSLEGLLEQALAAHERLPAVREARAMAHRALTSRYKHMSIQIRRTFDFKRALQLTPAGRLDVAERARFRLRRLREWERVAAGGSRAKGPPPIARELVDELHRDLQAYEHAVDAYLDAASEAQTLRERAILKSQRVRERLEGVKYQLLSQAGDQPQVYARIRRRCVRTKPAQWQAQRAPLWSLEGVGVAFAG